MKSVCWMLIAERERRDIDFVIPALAWAAKETGAIFETYLEGARSGKLFDSTGSCVVGGRHHQQFNYLNAAFDVHYIFLGNTTVFDSSVEAFGCKIIARTRSTLALYNTLFRTFPSIRPNALYRAPRVPIVSGLRIEPYLFPEIFFNKAFVIEPNEMDPGSADCIPALDCPITDMWLPNGRTYAAATLSVAHRWKNRAKGLAFGDPDSVRADMAAHCGADRIAVYAPLKRLAPRDIRICEYSEAKSEIAQEVSELAHEIGVNKIYGRQTCDGDIHEWSKSGLAIQITDPNRPPFQVVGTVRHPWSAGEPTLPKTEPPDEQLVEWMREGKILASLLWHSGEIAHNEAMVNLIDLASWTGIKMGVGVHADRYKTCPQFWELISVPVEAGGVEGLIEPLLYSGGNGILTEYHCPPKDLQEHCRTALSEISEICPNAVPRGYYSFLDSDLESFQTVRNDIFETIEAVGMEYFISCAKPGRNRVLYETDTFVAVNHSNRSIHTGSPFVRIKSVDEIHSCVPSIAPGWILCALDSPIHAFSPYIWRHGNEFMRIVDWLTQTEGVVNTTPHTIARYARMLRKTGNLDYR